MPALNSMPETSELPNVNVPDSASLLQGLPIEQSSTEFLKKLKEAGLEEQEEERYIYELKETINHIYCTNSYKNIENKFVTQYKLV